MSEVKEGLGVNCTTLLRFFVFVGTQGEHQIAILSVVVVNIHLSVSEGTLGIDGSVLFARHLFSACQPQYFFNDQLFGVRSRRRGSQVYTLRTCFSPFVT